jgi:hypothetical protein
MIPSSLADVVRAALQVEPPRPEDAATAALAETYARQIDEDGDLTKLGPALLAALEALHLSPRARAAAQKGLKSGAGKPAAGKLDELRRRRERKNPAAADHATTP